MRNLQTKEENNLAVKKDNLYTEPYNRTQVVGVVVINSQFVIPKPANVFILNNIQMSIEQEYRRFLKIVKDNYE